jgi:hypothetical protein
VLTFTSRGTRRIGVAIPDNGTNAGSARFVRTPQQGHACSRASALARNGCRWGHARSRWMPGGATAGTRSPSSRTRRARRHVRQHEVAGAACAARQAGRRDRSLRVQHRGATRHHPVLRVRGRQVAITVDT